MATTSEEDKLRVLLPHWIEHNAEHAAEFRRWAKAAGLAAADVEEAADQMLAANEALSAALEKLGGQGASRQVTPDHAHERAHEHD
jgi:alcohol dehydrogenase class IV